MTGVSARNSYGLFKTKKARNLANLYEINLNDFQEYIRKDKYITFKDVKFIVDNLWLSHFIYNELPKPIDLPFDKYVQLYSRLKSEYPNLDLNLQITNINYI
tara:strand:- start:481 stop:786 length:306 start_codon:yes stop_codon:yes gene_type:complete